ncbi:MAG: flagella basal body P-ring formation protein FlgA, partial [Candidatus Eiseniibacteriota bacterium]
LAPGLSLGAGDLRRELRPHWGPPAADPPPAPAAGWVTRRSIGAGDIVAWPAALPPAAVRDGQSVEVRWERGGVRVSTRATALQAAAEGERVRVRLADGSVNRDAVVVGAGVVAIQAGGRP